jgi:hypothetical protein
MKIESGDEGGYTPSLKDMNSAPFFTVIRTTYLSFDKDHS